jgi:phage-related protein
MLELAKSIKQLTQSGQGVTGFFDAFAKGFSRGFSKFPEFKEIMRFIRQSLKSMEYFGRLVGGEFAKLVKAFGLFDGLKKIFNPQAFRDLLGVDSKGKSTGKGIFSLFVKFREALSGKGEYSFAQLANDIFGQIKTFFGGGVGEGVSIFRGFFEKMIAAAGDILASAAPWIIDKATIFINQLADYLKNPSAFMAAAQGVSGGLGGAFVEAISKIWTAIQPAIAPLGDALLNLLSAVWERIGPTVTKVLGYYFAFAITKAITMALLHAAFAAIATGVVKKVGEILGKKLGFETAQQIPQSGKHQRRAGCERGEGRFFHSVKFST